MISTKRFADETFHTIALHRFATSFSCNHGIAILLRFERIWQHPGDHRSTRPRLAACPGSTHITIFTKSVLPGYHEVRTLPALTELVRARP